VSPAPCTCHFESGEQAEPVETVSNLPGGARDFRVGALPATGDSYNPALWSPVALRPDLSYSHPPDPGVDLPVLYCSFRC
jgi:hypothetical protein